MTEATRKRQKKKRSREGGSKGGAVATALDAADDYKLEPSTNVRIHGFSFFWNPSLRVMMAFISKNGENSFSAHAIMAGVKPITGDN